MNSTPYQQSGDTISFDKKHIWHPFTQAQTAPEPLEIVRGEASELIAKDGSRYLDLISSWWVNLHGHAHPAIAQAIATQAQQLEQVIFTNFTHAPAATLAHNISQLLPEDLQRVFFSDDGSTAVEVALKIAAQYWSNQGECRSRYIAFNGGYHGDTVGAMSLGQGSHFFDTYQQMLFQVDLFDYPHSCIDDTSAQQHEQEVLTQLELHLQRFGESTAAAVIEPLIQAAGGMRFCREQFLQQLVALLRKYGVLVIFDEVMTGFGRTGDLFACRKAAVTPDLITLSKGITGGFLPLSLTIARESIYQQFLSDSFDKALVHGHSFTANPIACAAANASLELLLDPKCRKNIVAIEALHQQRMRQLQEVAGTTRHRVCGTVAALDIICSDSGYSAAIGSELKQQFLQQGLLIRPLGNVLYLLPPYCTTEQQLHHAYDVITTILQNRNRR